MNAINRFFDNYLINPIKKDSTKISQVDQKTSRVAAFSLHKTSQNKESSKLPNLTPEANQTKLSLTIKRVISKILPDNQPPVAKTAGKVEKIVTIKLGKMKRVAQGSAKDIWVKIGTANEKVDEKVVYLTPVKTFYSSIYHSKKYEIEREVKIAKTIQQKLDIDNLTEILTLDLNEINAGIQASALVKKFSTMNDLLERTYLIPDPVKKFLVEDQKFNDHTAEKIINSIQKKTEFLIDGHLATDYKEIKFDIDGEKIYETPKAEGNVEEQFNEKIVPFPTSFKMASDFLKGLGNMHRTGYVHGDLKADNLLILGEHVSLSDFGKTTQLDAHTSVIHTGNTRYAPPEGRLSQKGEVYSAALVVIRMLEEEFLTKEKKADNLMLEEVNIASLSTVKPKDERRGIERFMMLNTAFPHRETRGLRNKISLMGRQLKLAIFSEKKDKYLTAEKEMHSYINTLTNKLKEKHPNDVAQIDKIKDLLKEMTNSNPIKRPIMGQVNQKIKEIGF